MIPQLQNVCYSFLGILVKVRIQRERGQISLTGVDGSDFCPLIQPFSPLFWLYLHLSLRKNLEYVIKAGQLEHLHHIGRQSLQSDLAAGLHTFLVGADDYSEPGAVDKPAVTEIQQKVSGSVAHISPHAFSEQGRFLNGK
ncbi:hypothetical protein D3C75_996840 [compost metagenome]